MACTHKVICYYECEAHSHLPCEWEAHSHLGYHCEACANSGYQALFSNFLTGVGNEASLFAWTNHLSQILKKCIQIFHKDWIYTCYSNIGWIHLQYAWTEAQHRQCIVYFFFWWGTRSKVVREVKQIVCEQCDTGLASWTGWTWTRFLPFPSLWFSSLYPPYL